MLASGTAIVNLPKSSLHKQSVKILEAGAAEKSGFNLVSSFTFGSQIYGPSAWISSLHLLPRVEEQHGAVDLISQLESQNQLLQDKLREKTHQMKDLRY
jgi:hypothetical protein